MKVQKIVKFYQNLDNTVNKHLLKVNNRNGKTSNQN